MNGFLYPWLKWIGGQYCMTSVRACVCVCVIAISDVLHDQRACVCVCVIAISDVLHDQRACVCVCVIAISDVLHDQRACVCVCVCNSYLRCIAWPYCTHMLQSIQYATHVLFMANSRKVSQYIYIYMCACVSVCVRVCVRGCVCILYLIAIWDVFLSIKQEVDHFVAVVVGESRMNFWKGSCKEVSFRYAF